LIWLQWPGQYWHQHGGHTYGFECLNLQHTIIFLGPCCVVLFFLSKRNITPWHRKFLMVTSKNERRIRWTLQYDITLLLVRNYHLSSHLKRLEFVNDKLSIAHNI
jgi:hypothetical protein